MSLIDESTFEEGSPIKRQGYQFFLDDDDIDELSRTTIIPFVNSNFKLIKNKTHRKEG